MTSTPFPFRDLEGSQQIRLFYLLPAETLNQPLRGKLENDSLDSSSFPALSYVCGKPNKTTEQNLEIRYRRRVSEVNKRSNSSSKLYDRKIQNNLATALRYLRDKRILNLIFRDAPVQHTNLVGRLKEAKTLSSLLDFGIWARLLFHEIDETDLRQPAKERFVTAQGI